MAVAARSQGLVAGLADWVVLGGDAPPMIDGVAQSDIGRLAHQHDAALAGPLGDRRYAGQAAQGLVVSSLQGFGRFCEQCGNTLHRLRAAAVPADPCTGARWRGLPTGHPPWHPA